MDPHTIRMPEDLLDDLADEAEEEGISRADYIRSLLRQRTEYDELRRENERLRRQLQAVNSRQDDVDELVEYVEEEREIQQRREERQSAPVWTRAKRWLFGYETDTSERGEV